MIIKKKNMSGIVVNLDELLAARTLLKKIKSKQQNGNHNNGIKKTLRRGRGMQATDVRHYSAGDELRHMEWRATARTGKPHVKIYEEEKERTILIITNFTDSMYFGSKKSFKSVIAANLSALLTWHAHDHGEYVSHFIINNNSTYETEPSKKTSSMVRYMQELAKNTEAYQMSHQLKSDLNLISCNNQYLKILNKIQKTVKPGSLLIFVADFYGINEHILNLLKILNHHQRVIIFQIFDELEITLPPTNNYPILYKNSTSTLMLTHRKVKRAYQEFCESHCNILKNWCVECGIDYHQVTSSTELVKLVHLALMQRRANG